MAMVATSPSTANPPNNRRRAPIRDSMVSVSLQAVYPMFWMRETARCMPDAPPCRGVAMVAGMWALAGSTHDIGPRITVPRANSRATWCSLENAMGAVSEGTPYLWARQGVRRWALGMGTMYLWARRAYRRWPRRRSGSRGVGGTGDRRPGGFNRREGRTG